ncbi:hypothetical protein J6590_029868 [Homalodisca vitripennis]|nr:hypothetical protein J6590_029868 [Homalodisca vitripennis]
MRQFKQPHETLRCAVADCLLKFTFFLVQRLELDAVTVFTPGIWSHFTAPIDKLLAKKPAQKQYLSSHTQEGPVPKTYPGSSHFGVRLAAKWQWPGHGIEQAGERRAVVGILGEGGITTA